MDDTIKRPRGLFALIAPLLGLPAVSAAVYSDGRNDRKAQRAGEIRPHDYSRDHPKQPSRRDLHRLQVHFAKPKAPGPKFAPERKRKPHHHPLRDEHGAYTLTGQSVLCRRKWVAGISQQRGY